MFNFCWRSVIFCPPLLSFASIYRPALVLRNALTIPVTLRLINNESARGDGASSLQGGGDSSIAGLRGHIQPHPSAPAHAFTFAPSLSSSLAPALSSPLGSPLASSLQAEQELLISGGVRLGAGARRLLMHVLIERGEPNGQMNK